MALEIDGRSPVMTNVVLVVLAVVVLVGGIALLTVGAADRRKASFNAMPDYKEDPRTTPHTCFALWENQVVTVDCERIPKNLLSSW